VHQFLSRRPWHANREYPLALIVAAGLLASLWSSTAAGAATPAPSPNTGHPATAGASPSPAPKTAAFGLGPATATALDERSNYVWSVTPAATLKDHVAVVNYSNQPLTLDLYPRDAFNAPNGNLNMQAKSVKPTDAGAWITVEIPGGASTLTVPARSTVIVPILLTVPRDASPGDHTGGIITSLTAKATATNGNQTVNPNLEQRVAVPVEIRVSGPVHAKLAVQAVKASYSQTLNPVGGGHATVTYHVVNTGNVNLGGHEAVSVSGLFGSTVHSQAPDVPVLLPGGSVTESVPVHGVLPEFLMSAHVTVSPLVPQGDVDPGLSDAHGAKHFWAVPWLLLGIIALLLLGWRQLRRRKRPTTSRHGTRSGGGTRRRGSGRVSAPPGRPAEVAPDGITVTRSVARVLRRLAAATLAAGLAVAVPAGTATASAKLPYTDPYSHGYVGFCDKNGNNVTQGSVYDKPFVWRAVSSVAAPTAYAGVGRKATLWAAQPRKGIDAGHWSGQALTASTNYTNPSVPMVQATNRDYALSDIINAFPPQWDRLLEVRIYFSAPGESGDQSTYAAADIRVSGTTWTVVSGGKVDCNAGSAVSPEVALPSSNPAGLQPAEPLSAIAAEAVGAPIPNGSSAPSDGSVAPSAVADASASSSGGSGHTVAIVAVVVVVVVGVGGGGLWLRRRARGRVT
jgi:WxL interacting protein linking bacterial and host surfaces